MADGKRWMEIAVIGAIVILTLAALLMIFTDMQGWF